MKPVVRWLSLAVVLLAWSAPVAAADPFAVAVPDALRTPVLMGDAVAWADGVLISSVDATGTVRELARLTPVPGLKAPTVAASGDVLAVHERAETCVSSDACKYGVYQVHANAVLAGRVGSPLECVTGFTPDQSCGPAPGGEPVVRGSVLAVPVGESTLVRDYASGDTATIALRAVRVSGDLAAGLRGPGTSPPTLVVMRWRTGEELMELPGAAAEWGVLGVGDDGTVTFTMPPRPGGETTTVAWASPADPQAHVITTLRGPPSSALAAGGLVARMRTRVWALNAPARFEVFERAGQAAQFDEPAFAGGWDFDGSQVAFAARPCAVSWLVVAHVGSPVPGHPEGLCPPSRPRGSARWSGRTITFTLACEDSSGLGCAGTVRVRAGAVVLGDVAAELAPGASGSFSIGPDRPRLRWLRRHRPRRVTVVSAGRTSPAVGRHPLVRAGVVPLVRG